MQRKRDQANREAERVRKEYEAKFQREAEERRRKFAEEERRRKEEERRRLN
jgi:hypothetical protein